MDEGTSERIVSIFPSDPKEDQKEVLLASIEFENIKRTGLLYSINGSMVESTGQRSNLTVWFNAYNEPILIISNCVGVGSEFTEWKARKGWQPMNCVR